MIETLTRCVNEYRKSKRFSVAEELGALTDKDFQCCDLIQPPLRAEYASERGLSTLAYIDSDGVLFDGSCPPIDLRDFRCYFGCVDNHLHYVLDSAAGIQEINTLRNFSGDVIQGYFSTAVGGGVCYNKRVSKNKNPEITIKPWNAENSKIIIDIPLTDL